MLTFCLVSVLNLIGNWCGLVSVVVLLLFVFVCNFGHLTFYSKLVTTFPTGSAGRNSTYRFNPFECCSFLLYA